METHYVAIGFFKSSDGSSDVGSVNILGIFKEEREAQIACVRYFKSILVDIFTDRLDDEPSYAKEWLNKIERLQTIEASQQLPKMWEMVEEIYSGDFGPQVRIESVNIKNEV